MIAHTPRGLVEAVRHRFKEDRGSGDPFLDSHVAVGETAQKNSGSVLSKRERRNPQNTLFPPMSLSIALPLPFPVLSLRERTGLREEGPSP